MDAGDDHPLVASIREASLCADEDIEFVVAFGSQLTGDSTDRSDFDIAVKFADELSASEQFTKRCFLSGDLQADELPFVDVSDIETLPVEVAHEAINGTVVCGDTAVFDQYTAAVEASFHDQREERRHTQRQLIDRIATEGLRG